MFCFLPLGKGGGIVQLPEYPLRGQQHATRMVSTIHSERERDRSAALTYLFMPLCI